KILQQLFRVDVDAVVASVRAKDIRVESDGWGSALRHHRAPDRLTRALITRMPETVRAASKANTRQAAEPAQICGILRPSNQYAATNTTKPRVILIPFLGKTACPDSLLTR